MVARPRTLLPWADTVIDKTTVRTSRGALNLKTVFIWVEPPGKPRADLQGWRWNENRIVISLSFDSQFASFRCLSGCSESQFRSTFRRARETITRLNACN